jgi:hypothetical protein
MTIDLILQSLEDWLRPLVEGQGGIVDVAETADDALQMLSGNAPTKWRVILTATGDTLADDPTAASGYVVGGLSAIVQAPLGLSAKPGKTLHRTTSGNASFLARLNFVIRKLRAVAFDDDEIDCERNLMFRDWAWLREGAETRGWRAAEVRFDLYYVLDDPAGDGSEDPPITIAGSGRLVPPGGTLGQVLAKASVADYGLTWRSVIYGEPNQAGTHLILRQPDGTAFGSIAFEPYSDP